MARPQIELSQKEFENLCFIQCTLSEIAGWFRCSEDTVERWCKRTYKMGFAECFKKYSQGGLISLRRAQFELAKRNAAMAIFLGKNYLGQRDEPVQNMTSAIKQANAQIADLASMINHPQESRDVNEFAIELPDEDETADDAK